MAIDLEGTVLGIVGDVLDVPVADLKAVPALATHDWDSLAALEVLAQVEATLDVVLDLRSFNTVRTIGDLVALVEGELAVGQSE